MRKELLENITESISKRIPYNWYVNAGGCGIFAKILHNELKRRGVSSKIALLDRHRDRSVFFQMNRSLGLKQSADHIMIRVKTSEGVFYVDSSGCKTLREAKQYGNYSMSCVGFYSLDDLRQSLSKKSQWNPLYNRGRNVNLRRIIKDEVQNHFATTKAG